MIYEMRMFDLKPGKMGEFEKCCSLLRGILGLRFRWTGCFGQGVR